MKSLVSLGFLLISFSSLSETVDCRINGYHGSCRVSGCKPLVMLCGDRNGHIESETPLKYVKVYAIDREGNPTLVTIDNPPGNATDYYNPTEETKLAIQSQLRGDLTLDDPIGFAGFGLDGQTKLYERADSRFSNETIIPKPRLEVREMYVDSVGNRKVVIFDNETNFTRDYIVPAGTSDLKPLKDSRDFISLSSELRGQGNRKTNSYYQGFEDSCIEVKNSDGQLRYYQGESSLRDFEDFSPATGVYEEADSEAIEAFTQEINSSDYSLPSLPSRIVPQHIARDPASGKIYYVDQDINRPAGSVRIFEGTPGNMREVELPTTGRRRRGGRTRCPSPDVYRLDENRVLTLSGFSGSFLQTLSNGERPRGGGCNSRAPSTSEPGITSLVNFSKDDVDEEFLRSLGISGVPSDEIDYTSPCSVPSLERSLQELEQLDAALSSPSAYQSLRVENSGRGTPSEATVIKKNEEPSLKKAGSK